MSRVPRPRFLTAAALGLLAALALGTGSAAAATGGPAWQISAYPYPSNLTPGAVGSWRFGPGYLIVATNVGSAPTEGIYTITDLLPSGLTFVGGQVHARDDRNNPVECTVAPRRLVCQGGDGTPEGEPLRAGGSVWVNAAVEVSPTVRETRTDRARVEGGGGSEASVKAPTSVGSTTLPFGFLQGTPGLLSAASAAMGQPSTQAGSHLYQLSLGFGFTSYLSETSFYGTGGGLRDLRVDLPPGFVVNPSATPTCTEAQLESDNSLQEGSDCPPESQVGTVTVLTNVGNAVAPVTSNLYNMVAPPGKAAELAFDAAYAGVYVHLMGSVRSDGDFGLTSDTTDILAKTPIFGVQVSLWGDPSAPAHDAIRSGCQLYGGSCPVPRLNTAFLTQPSACSGPLTTIATADSWLAPGAFVSAATESQDMNENAVGIDGCLVLRFDPTLSLTPEVTTADSPTGLSVDLHVPQDESYEDPSTGEGRLAEANLKAAKVTLPEGLVVNPSSANGLAACSPAQIGMSTAVGQSPVHFTDEPPSCPDASKLGTLELDTPLIGHPLPGAIFLASQGENPFGSLLAIYLVVDDPQTGIVIKLAGRLDADPTTGRLTASFAENPQLPFEDLRLSFTGGATGPLRTPAICGSHATRSQLTPWSGTAAVSTSDAFSVGEGCSPSEGRQPNSPAFEAGTLTPLAGAYSPFVLRLRREDGSQAIAGLDVDLPPGLTGRVAGIPYCPDSSLAAAAASSGTDEQASPSCPSASQVGTVTVGAGAGPRPYYVQGKAYLAGPYKGAPLSLAIVTPAVAGPFDLGTVVVRSALHVDPETARISVRSDPIPTILQGIPLDIRSIAVKLDRSGFTLNPTSCEMMALGAASVSAQGHVAQLSNRFQVGGCKKLRFGPKLKLRVLGKTNRNAKPRLKAVLTTRPGEANIRRAQVNLPHSEFLEQNHIKTVCTRVQWAEGNGNGSACPKGSIYGRAKAWTPLLDHPLEGYVYLRSNGGARKLPDLVAGLNGQVNIALWGKVDSGPNKGIRNTFEVVPDAPVSRFVLEINGGRKGLLVNSENLCKAKKSRRRAIVRFTGQNGKIEQFKPVVANQCGKHRRKTRKRNGHRGNRTNAKRHAGHMSGGRGERKG